MTKKKLYLALDAHARHCVLGIMNAQGEFLGATRFETSEKALESHLSAIDAYQSSSLYDLARLYFWRGASEAGMYSAIRHSKSLNH